MPANMTMTPTLLLRVHTDQRLGLGHIARALAIYAPWNALGGKAILAVSGDGMAQRIGSGLHPWQEQPLPMETVYLGEDHLATIPSTLKDQANLALLDLWDADPAHIEGLRPLKVAIMEDEGDAHEGADLLFQPYLEGVSWSNGPVRVVNGRKLKPFESQSGKCRVLRGSSFIVVSPESVKLRPRREPLQPLVVRKLLITFGPTDGAGLAQRSFNVMRDLIAQDRWNGVCTLISPRSLEGPVIPGCSVVCSIPDLTRHLQEFDGIWCSGGVTLVEAACMGVPCAAWGQNPRHHQVISDLAQANACLNLGLGPEENLEHTGAALAKWLGPEGQENRQEQTKDGMALVDGSGVTRIAKELWALAEG
jgi:spore coat polysaccharide biosynthesis predicted glycosyltransferase SpsG